ncbi:hypothetical protein L7F22_012573 [Adiantum nelumboides]|nr:hypothetical protein [Adiantum nelumboides]
MEILSLLRSSRLLSSCLFFAGIYILGYCIIFARQWRRGAPERYKAASCCMSIVHGPSTSLAASLYMIRLFYMERQPLSAYPHDMNAWLNSHLGASNTPFEEAIMEFSIAYFLIDLLHYVLFPPYFHNILHALLPLLHQTRWLLHNRSLRRRRVHVIVAKLVNNCLSYKEHYPLQQVEHPLSHHVHHLSRHSDAMGDMATLSVLFVLPSSFSSGSKLACTVLNVQCVDGHCGELVLGGRALGKAHV